jgi:hypothetical protein
MRLCGVLQHVQAMLLRQRAQGIEVGWLPIQMHRHDGTCATGDRGRNARRVQVAGAFERLDRDRHGPALADRKPGGDEGVAGDDNFIAGAHAHGPQREGQGIKAVGHRHTVGGAGKSGELVFEGLDFAAADVAARAQTAQHGRLDLGLQLQEAGIQIQKWCGHSFQRARMNSA